MHHIVHRLGRVGLSVRRRGESGQRSNGGHYDQMIPFHVPSHRDRARCGVSPSRGRLVRRPRTTAPFRRSVGLRGAGSSLHAWAGAPERSKRRPLPLTTSLRSIWLGPSTTAKVIATAVAAVVLWSSSSTDAQDLGHGVASLCLTNPSNRLTARRPERKIRSA